MNNKEIQSRVKFYQQKLVQLAADNSRQQIAGWLLAVMNFLLSCIFNAKLNCHVVIEI